MFFTKISDPEHIVFFDKSAKYDNIYYIYTNTRKVNKSERVGYITKDYL